MSHKQERIARNYRIAEQRRKQAEREEQERILAENEDLAADNDKLQRRARRAEADYYNILDSAHVLEERETGRIFARLLAEMLAGDKMRGSLRLLIEQIEERLLLRIDPHRGPQGIELGVQNRRSEGRVAFSVRIPELHITVCEDARMLQMITGKSGPVVMDDRPLHVVEDPYPSWNSFDPNEKISQELLVKTI